MLLPCGETAMAPPFKKEFPAHGGLRLEPRVLDTWMLGSWRLKSCRLGTITEDALRLKREADIYIYMYIYIYIYIHKKLHLVRAL